jgi:nucleotide-binding universal stress UspA family protein
LAIALKILAAVDASQDAEKAFDYAIQLARLSGGKVSIIHVVQSPPPPTAGDVGISVAKLDELFTEEGQKLVDKFVNLAKTKYSLTIEGILEKGRSPSEVIVDTARKRSASLIVIGSRGLSGIKEFFLGSVSSGVAHKAAIPVLIVR